MNFLTFVYLLIKSFFYIILLIKVPKIVVSDKDDMKNGSEEKTFDLIVPSEIVNINYIAH